VSEGWCGAAQVYTLSAPTKGIEKHRPQDNVMAARRDTLFRAGLVATPATIKTSFEEARDDEEVCPCTASITATQ
jgi:hypothetical protein